MYLSMVEKPSGHDLWTPLLSSVVVEMPLHLRLMPIICPTLHAIMTNVTLQVFLINYLIAFCTSIFVVHCFIQMHTRSVRRCAPMIRYCRLLSSRRHCRAPATKKWNMIYNLFLPKCSFVPARRSHQRTMLKSVIVEKGRNKFTPNALCWSNGEQYRCWGRRRVIA